MKRENGNTIFGGMCKFFGGTCGAPAAGGAGDEQRLPVFRYGFLLCTPILSIIQTMKNTPCLSAGGGVSLLLKGCN